MGCHTYINQARIAADLVRGYAMLATVLRTFSRAIVLPFDDAAAAVSALVIAAVYNFTAPAKGRTPSFVPTLVLLCILIAIVTQVVGESGAKAFTLVGTLSIVRFRTSLRDRSARTSDRSAFQSAMIAS